MPDLNIRRILTALFLVIAAFAVILVIGARGMGKKIGAPGVDILVSQILERFSLSGGPTSDATLPSNIGEIVGTWSGVSDVDGTTWKFTFENNYAVRVSSSSGYSFDGTAFVHWNLGQIEGHLRVPPGWGILDVDTINSSEQSHRNKVSLGAYSLREGVLKYCFSEPGRMTRPITDLSKEGIRCFDLTKEAAGMAGPANRPTPAVAAKAQQPSRDTPPDVLPPSSIAGEAEIIINGSQKTWLLRTDRDSVTDFTDPHRLTLQFQAAGAKFPAAARIELTLDATRTGRHIADGFVYLENLFIREKVPVGSDKSGAPQAVFLYIAEGGRIFPPRLTCDIRIRRSYSGGRDIELSGDLPGCTVYSAGEQVMIGPMSFRAAGRRN
jgi:hypothetical protein